MKHVSEILPAIVKPEMKPLTPKQERLLSMPDYEERPIDPLYQHSVMCQCYMPYRNPGDVRIWKRKNGAVRFELQAGRLLDPRVDDFVDLGLPFGPKPRLVLFYLQTQALETGSPSVEVEESLTAFVTRILGLDKHGRNIRTVRDQLNRLAASDFRLGMTMDDKAVTVKGSILSRIELWTPKNERQRVLWPTIVQFSRDYFDSLSEHAVPLDKEAIVRLKDSAMGLDVYTWLAHRMHRVHPRKPAFVPWAPPKHEKRGNSLYEQFGEGYTRLVDFRRFFNRMLREVKAVYPKARFTTDEKGMLLYNSPPPVPRKIQPVITLPTAQSQPTE
jgi:hypothetical protein